MQKSSNDKGNAKLILKRAGLRATVQRVGLVSTIMSAGTPLSIDNILKECRSGKNVPDKATAYRTMRELETAGLVNEVDVGHGHAHFELARGDHHHLVCTGCDKIVELEDCEVESFEKKVLKTKKSFRSIGGHRLTFFGLCKKC